MDADYLIAGQGICGTLLSRELMMAGKTVIVVDDRSVSSSLAAGGIINPVTGKRLVRSWMIEELQSFAWDTYTTFGRELGTTIIQHSDILDFYATREMADIFTAKLDEEKEYLSTIDDGGWSQYFRFNYGIGKIAPCMLVDIRTMLSTWRQYLQNKGALLEETLNITDCVVTKEQVTYKNIKAGKLIFCDGAACATNPFFKKLPWSKDKGEALLVSIPGLPRCNIFKQGTISIVPWQDDLFWVGAAHDWKYVDLSPTAAFRRRVEEQFDYWLKIPYKVIDHIVALRPANMDRRPFVGLHPLYPAVGILNGMGGKGCAMAPYFADNFAQHLLHGTTLLPDVDIKRFTRMLSR